MSLANLATRPVTYLRWSQSGTDAYGNPQDTWTADGSPSYVWLEQTDATEVVVNENTQISNWRLIDPNPDAGLTGRDRVQINGDTFRVIGPPHVAWNPRGPHHLVARLQYIDP